jgi:methyl-accepting chemotaxis protein
MKKDFSALNEVLSQVIKGDLSARVDLSSIAEDYRSIAELINTLIEKIEKREERLNNAIRRAQGTIEKLRTREFALKSAILNFGEVLSKVSKGDLTAKVDLNTISREYKPIGEDINKMISATQKNIEKLKNKEINLRNAISNFGSVLSSAAKGDLTQKVDLLKIPAEYCPIGDNINSTIASFNRMINTIKGASKDVSDKAERMARASEETGSAIEEIAESMKAVAEEAEKQATAAMKQASAAEETQSALEEQTRASERLSTIGQELLHLSDNLSNTLKPFKIKPAKQKVG